MNPDSNFLDVMKDLERCANGWNAYDLLRIPGQLRLLLVDGAPLVDQVNRKHRLKLRFSVGHTLQLDHLTEQEAQDTILASVADSFDPEFLQQYSLEPPQSQAVAKDAFLQLKVMAVGEATFTVKDLICHLAYVHGLTHGGEPKTPKDAALLDLRRKVELGEVSVGLREIRAVGRIVYRGLVSLRDAVENDAAYHHYEVPCQVD